MEKIIKSNFNKNLLNNYIGYFDILFKEQKIYYNQKLENYILKPLKLIDPNLGGLEKLIYQNIDLQRDSIIRVYIFYDKNFKFYFEQNPLNNLDNLRLITDKEPFFLKNNYIFNFWDRLVFVQNLYKKKGYDAFISLNSKYRLLKSDLGDLLVFYNKNVYFLDIRNKFISPHPIVRYIIKNLKDKIKKSIGKNNGFSLRLISSADEVYIVSNIGIHTVQKIRYGKNVFTYKKHNFKQILEKIFDNYGKKILRSMER